MLISGLRFFYEHTQKNEDIALKLPKRQKPVILSAVFSGKEVSRIIDATLNIKHRFVLMTAYNELELFLSDCAWIVLMNLETSIVQEGEI